MNDHAARADASLRNFDCFGAPCALFISVDSIVDRNGWAHVGMFVQSLLLAAHARGLATCPQEAWSSWPKLVAEHIGLPDDEVLWCAVAIGYADESDPVNSLKTERESVEVFARL